MTTIQLSPRIRALTDWLVLGGGRIRQLDDLFPAVCAELALHFPVDRISLNLEVIHPELSGQGREWVRGKDIAVHEAPRGMELHEDYLSSPVKVVDDTGEPFRARLEETDHGMGVLRRLRGEGYSDYYIVPLAFQDSNRTAAVSFATRQAGGFTPEDIADLTHAAAALSPVVEARVVRSIATDLLSVYLGREPGARVYNGQIRRGDCSSIFAAILFCDLRGFTAYTQAHTSDEVIGRLNVWFGHAVQAVEGSGGEVLKFMGDGLLAIFPADEMNPREACGHALTATAALDRAVANWNADRPDGVPEIDYVLSLHLGYVAFGNIGGARRLDFTVVGPAVNQASRLLDLAKQMDRRLLVTRAFAGCSGRVFQDMGTFPLRGLPKPEPVFAPPDPVPEAA